MGEVGVVLRRIAVAITALACVAITIYNADRLDINTDGTFHLVGEYSPTYYEMLSDNVGMTTINGISNVYVNMETAGYSLYSETITSNSIDASFVKDGHPSYRFYYSHPDGRITFFCSDYESSFTGLAYIIDRME